jgi:hypothetical protein
MRHYPGSQMAPRIFFDSSEFQEEIKPTNHQRIRAQVWVRCFLVLLSFEVSARGVKSQPPDLGLYKPGITIHSLAGSQSSILLPSGSLTHAKFP